MQFEFSGEREIYVEIAERYKNYISSGILTEGEKLPSVRQAALRFGVNPNTVQRAYVLLEGEGYIKSFPKKGAYVQVRGSDIKRIPDFRDALRSMKESGISREELILQISEVFDND